MADGSINIDTKIDQKGFNVGVVKMRNSASKLKVVIGDVLAGGLDKAVALSGKLRESFSKLGATLSSVFKKLLIGGLLAFALSIGRVLQIIREGIGELVNIRGGTLQKDIEEIKFKFVELRASVAAAFLPLLEAAIPYIKMALDWLTQMFNRVAMITAAFLGQKKVLQVIPGSAKKLADETKKTEKAARGALAAFDEINVLQQDAAAAEEANPATVAAEMVPITDDILSRVQAIKDEIAAWFADPIGKLKETWGKIADWFRENVIAPIRSKWNELWEQAKITAASFAADFSQTTLGKILLGFYELVQGVLNTIYKLGQETINTVYSVGQGAFNSVLTIGQGILNSVYTFGQGVLNSIYATVKNIVGWITANVFIPLREGFGAALDWISEKFRAVFDGVRNFVYNTINKIVGFINEMINSILAGISAVLSAASSISGAFSMPSVGSGIGTALNGILGSIKIPKLATGTVIPPNAAFAAVLGDNKREAEVVSPLSTIEQAVRNAMAGSGETIENVIMLDGEVLYKASKRVERKHGASLIAGGTVS